MQFDFDNGEPIFRQVAEQIEDAIFTGAFKEAEQIPSTTEIAKQFHINPATVLKGMNLLVNEGLLVKQRGMGTFVVEGAQQQVIDKRRADFFDRYVVDLIGEADKLKLTPEDVLALVKRGYQHGND